jgi:sulfatase maturation enzyme AslB (radical SAM superfamily)
MTKFFCPAPWKALYSHVNEMAVCCASTKKFKMSPKEFLASEYLLELREKFLRGEIDDTCSHCVDAEANNLQSIRQHFIRRHGEDTKENLSHMELRASNLCNFQCKMCDADSSSLIAGIVKTVTDNNWQEVLDLSEHLKSLTLTGGEPMIIKQYYQLLDHLIEKNKTNIILRIYTNCSSYNPIFIEKILKFRTVLHLSIDGVGSTAELQRTGTDWNTVNDNVHRFLKLPLGVVFHTTFTSLNITDVFSLSKYYLELNKLKPKLFFMAHSVGGNNEFTLSNMDDDAKKLAIEEIDKSLEILNEECLFAFKEELMSIKKLLENS